MTEETSATVFLRVSVGAVAVILIASIYVVSNASFFFHGNQMEFGDFAKDALRITNAKHFAEIYGPHSRWGFYTPVPHFCISTLQESTCFTIGWAYRRPTPRTCSSALFFKWRARSSLCFTSRKKLP